MVGNTTDARAWLALVALTACAPKPPPPPPTQGSISLVMEDPAPPPVLTAPNSPVGQPAVAMPGAPELPPLSGALVDIDFVTLNTTTQTFTVDADTPMFPVTDPRVAFRLQAALEFDPRWRVGLWEGQTVAWKRGADANGWAAPWGGYLTAKGITARALYRFDKRPDDHPWTASGLVARNEAGTKSMKVRGWKVDQGAWEGQMAAAFTIEGAGVSFEMHEVSAQLTLSATQQVLQGATMRAEATAAQLAGGNLQRSSLAMVPPDEPRIGESSVQVVRSQRFGGLDIRGRVNGGRPGWVWVRLIDNQGRTWKEAVLAQSTAERIGHDSNPQLQSYFQSTVPVSGAVPMAGQAEVWFQADDEPTVRRLTVSPFALGPPLEGDRVPAG